jgi:hypothetical protein
MTFKVGDKTNLTHGHRRPKRSRTYISWDSAIARCHRESHPKYEDYGGRGIVVCERWRGPGGFANFLADMGERPENLTLDREDVNGNYEPGNCRWSSLIVQRWNRRDMVHRSPPWQPDKLLSDQPQSQTEDKTKEKEWGF